MPGGMPAGRTDLTGRVNRAKVRGRYSECRRGAQRGNKGLTEGDLMNRDKLIEMLERDTSTTEEVDTSTEPPGKPLSEAERAVLKIQETKTPTGKIWGVKREKKEKKLTPQMQCFVNAILAGQTKVEAYKSAYNVRTNSEAMMVANANKLLKDSRIASLLGSLDDALKEKVIDDAVKTRRFVMERLHARVMAAKTESAELKALELMGRAVAMFTDNVDQKVRQIDTNQLKEELRSHLTLLENVVPLEKRTA